MHIDINPDCTLSFRLLQHFQHFFAVDVVRHGHVVQQRIGAPFLGRPADLAGNGDARGPAAAGKVDGLSRLISETAIDPVDSLAR